MGPLEEETASANAFLGSVEFSSAEGPLKSSGLVAHLFSLDAHFVKSKNQEVHKRPIFF